VGIRAPMEVKTRGGRKGIVLPSDIGDVAQAVWGPMHKPLMDQNGKDSYQRED